MTTSKKTDIRSLENRNEPVSVDDFLHMIAWGDVGFGINHAGLPRGRVTLGTLELSEDERRPRSWASLVLTDPCVRAIVPKMRSCDMDEMSFVFILRLEKWVDIKKSPEHARID